MLTQSRKPRSKSVVAKRHEGRRMIRRGVATLLHTACHSSGEIMAYSERARELRRCKATRKDGQPCRAYAVWGQELCAGHAYKTRGGRMPERFRYTGMPTNAPSCTCTAYNWPHRPGGGLCRWPDAPKFRLTTPAGTHSDLRTYKRRYRALARKFGMRL